MRRAAGHQMHRIPIAATSAAILTAFATSSSPTMKYISGAR